MTRGSVELFSASAAGSAPISHFQIWANRSGGLVTARHHHRHHPAGDRACPVGDRACPDLHRQAANSTARKPSALNRHAAQISLGAELQLAFSVEWPRRAVVQLQAVSRSLTACKKIFCCAQSVRGVLVSPEPEKGGRAVPSGFSKRSGVGHRAALPGARKTSAQGNGQYFRATTPASFPASGSP